MFCGSRTARDKSANARSAHADLTARLEDASQRWSLTGATDAAPIVICAAGLELHDVPWLVPRRTSSLSLMLYESRIEGVPRRAPGRQAGLPGALRAR